MNHQLIINILNGEEAGKRIVLDSTNLHPGVLIGGRDNPDLLMQHSSISGRHAALFFKDGAWFVTDLGSTNHTWIENQKLRSSCEYQLYDGMRLDFGELKTAVELVAAANRTERQDQPRPPSMNPCYGVSAEVTGEAGPLPQAALSAVEAAVGSGERNGGGCAPTDAVPAAIPFPPASRVPLESNQGSSAGELEAVEAMLRARCSPIFEAFSQNLEAALDQLKQVSRREPDWGELSAIVGILRKALGDLGMLRIQLNVAARE